MNPGTLYIVATPLGNLADLSGRAVDVLRAVPIVAAEDTRRSKTLLERIGATGRLISFHAHSGPNRRNELVKHLASGMDVALVSDAGTPTVSDPGVSLVVEARARGCPVVALPGPSAVVAALSVSGLPADRFTFLGFLPRKGKDRADLLEGIARSRWTVVLFEAANRLDALLEDLIARCGAERDIAVVRELTKVHEEVRAGTLESVAGYYRENPARGEVTVVIAAAERQSPTFDEEEARRRGRALLRAGTTGRDAAARLAEEMDIPRNAAYKIINTL